MPEVTVTRDYCASICEEEGSLSDALARTVTSGREIRNEALQSPKNHEKIDVRLDAVTESVGVLRFHLSRAFTAATGTLLTGYARPDG